MQWSLKLTVVLKTHLDCDGYLRVSSGNMPDNRTSSDYSKLYKDIDSLKQVVADFASTVKKLEKVHVSTSP